MNDAGFQMHNRTIRQLLEGLSTAAASDEREKNEDDGDGTQMLSE